MPEKEETSNGGFDARAGSRKASPPEPERDEAGDEHAPPEEEEGADEQASQRERRNERTREGEEPPFNVW